MFTLKSLSQLHRSVFVKLFLSFMVSCILVVGLVQFFMLKVVNPNSTQLRTQDTNRSEYTLYLVDHLGLPPDLRKAEKMAKDLDLGIQIEGPGVLFSTSAKSASSSQLSPSPLLPYEMLQKSSRRCPTRPVSVGKWGQQIVTLVERGDYRYIFSFKSDAFSEGRIDLIPLLIGMILLVLIGCFVWIQWLFKPLRSLIQGVERVSAGDLTVTVPIASHDEIGRLAKSFNEMVLKVREMLAAREQLLLDVSHELRSPLTRMKVALELDGPECKERLKTNIRILERMIEELLESARLDHQGLVLNRVPTEIRSWLEEVIEPFKNEGPGIIFHPSSNTSVLSVDRCKLQTAIRNVIENGMKYSAFQGCPVELSVAQPDPTHLMIQVQDFGCGIPVSEHGLVFEPFYRVDKSRVRKTGGYGLGLSLCKKITEAHDGKLILKSVEGQGTLIQMILTLS